MNTSGCNKLCTAFNLLVAIFILALAGSKIADYNAWKRLQTPSGNPSVLTCYNQPQDKLIYQHGKYWVLSNIVRANLSAESNCRAHVTLTYQGSCKELFKLIELRNNLQTEARTSFVVYLEKQDEVNRMLSILRYAKMCRGFETRFFSYHLYLPFANKIKILPKWELEVRKSTVNCPKLKQELSNDLQAVARVDETTRIVGANIAQEEAGTLLVLPTATDAFPNNPKVYNFMFRLGLIARCEGSAGLQKTVFRFPTIQVKHLDPNIVNARFSVLDLRDLIKINETNQQFLLNDNNSKWLSESEHPICYGKLTCAQVLQEYPLNILGFSSLPLLDENYNLTVAESEKLRVKALCLQGHRFFNTRTNFVLQNVKTFEVANRTALSTTSTNILREYRVMFKEAIERTSTAVPMSKKKQENIIQI